MFKLQWTLKQCTFLHAQVLEAEAAAERMMIKSQTLQKGEIAPDFVSSRPDGACWLFQI